MAGDSEEQQALALLQKEMLAFILEGVTERIERGEAPVLADGVAAAIGRHVQTAIENGLRDFDLPTAQRIAEEAVRRARAAPDASAHSVDLSQSSHGNPEVQVDGEGKRARRRGWRRLASPVWLIALLLLLLGLAGWFLWQTSNALRAESAAKTMIAVERDSLSGDLCKSAKAQQEQLAQLRNTSAYKATCPEQPPPGGPSEFCQRVAALDAASRPGIDCSGK